MSLYGDMIAGRSKHDEIWKALADGTRREILDVLASGPKTTGDLVAHFEDLCRTNVMKHIEVLVDANLIIVRREGRVRWNQLNAAPIQSVCDRWVSKHVKKMASAMSRLKEHAESKERNSTDGSSANRKTRKTSRKRAKA